MLTSHLSGGYADKAYAKTLLQVQKHACGIEGDIANQKLKCIGSTAVPRHLLPSSPIPPTVAGKNIQANKATERLVCNAISCALHQAAARFLQSYCRKALSVINVI
jgi:hypothetical protein